MTATIRKWLLACFVAMVLTCMVGWVFGRDPVQLVPILMAVLGGLGVGEASNIGKRWTTKVELMEKPDDSPTS